MSEVRRPRPGRLIDQMGEGSVLEQDKRRRMLLANIIAATTAILTPCRNSSS
jgi:hypothetical protein